MSFDDELRRALKPVDPGSDFTARVLAAVARERPGSVAEPLSVIGVPVAVRPRRAPFWVWPVLAASLAGAVAGGQWWEERRELARGLAARAQVIEALRLTSSKLAGAREAVVERNYQSVR